MPYREYAAAIFELDEEGIPVIQARIAEWLGVSRPSVSEMVKRRSRRPPPPPGRAIPIGGARSAVGEGSRRSRGLGARDLG